MVEFQPISEKYAQVKLGSSSPNRGEHKKSLKPPPSNMLNPKHAALESDEVSFSMAADLRVLSSDFWRKYLAGIPTEKFTLRTLQNDCLLTDYC